MRMQPYYQPVPAAPAPFSVNSNFNDPTFPSGQTSAFAVSISNSQAITIFGASSPQALIHSFVLCLEADLDGQARACTASSRTTGRRA